MAMSLQQLLSSLSALQIICFMTMLNLNYPGNAITVANIFLDIFKAEVIDPQLLTDILNLDLEFEFEYKKQQSIKDNFFISNYDNFGFETYNPILNLGGFFLILALYPLQLFICKIVRKIVIYLVYRREAEKKFHEEQGTRVPRRKY